MAFLLPASLYAKTKSTAKKVDLKTALRYAGTAPLPNVSGTTATPPMKLTVSGCKKQSSSAFTCSVEVAYTPAAQPGTTRTSSPAADYQVRVSYPTGHSKTPQAKVVGPVHVVG
ncbi:MAG TPA: hypothetical protein VGY97_09735 [Solirubrobacteraceae bacterium]|nr:hypothetical protein [Solirubrobacteraceae bacterium]